MQHGHVSMKDISRLETELEEALARAERAEARLEALREMMSVPGSSICHRSSSGLIVFQPTMSNKNYIYSGRKNYKPRVVRACTFDELIDQWQKAGGGDARDKQI